MFEINIDLIKKYDKPGPRYTSYPTAPHFTEAFTSEKYLDEIIRTNNQADQPELSLYYHLPFCDTLCYFCGCNMIITRNRDRIKEYIKYLKNEIDLLRTYITTGRKVAQLHWGGGTPTHLNPDEITDLISFINQSFEIKTDAEQGCEIDPRGLTKEHLAALRNGGFNRISMGVQDFNSDVQKAVNRVQPEDMTRQVVSWVRELGFQSINLDLMYGLPFQTIESFEKTVDATINISPDRIAVFNYAHVPWMKKHMNLINPDDLPSAEDKLQILKMTIEKLTSAGYDFIGMDHFAKPTDELSIAQREKKLYRNFQGYSTHAGTDLYGMGITSISQVGKCYVQNKKREKEYFDSLNDQTLPIERGVYLTDDDILRRHVITKVMCDFELDFSDVEKSFKIEFENYFGSSLESMKDFIDDGLVKLSNRKLEVTQMGRLLIRNIAMNFDGYIERKEDKARYSRTV
ncbi:MAG: oxygen-independent coproporphyrinogen III oxidase [Stygiobacter sp. RIFOXYC12_FULL_38_8]|nr:MAG: oxygen-independent coproporphyrinogen III oxidase [Stygiobacter sp. RIFOXYB2_FULL_37_11]OGV10983.1 MAG: oxygen-independent coproporphyrinogen III oxidase [Stygiobacter sp. RIFOXYA2_FULL_38_8]OGV15817.1 MAG: oxygen-independent coproporphyrinogen III oxidase [Stygiobacter sp. RIFOXYC2_FULL_38_25]OGV29216.1 MAG: oxygen-independent coproporphyrinogen III oxidase [Stygiobacter sp. RIFOXYC12_FULL_38_8]OGV80931.1 MAG: oxygen-independent coproporphyrinogen III oxidase [Stygiobacter sp. GWF2_38_